MELQSGNAQLGLESAIFFVSCDLEIWHMALEAIWHIFYATSRFVHHLIAIGEFKQELQSGNDQIGQIWAIFLSHVTLEFDGWPRKTTGHLS